MAEAKTAVLGAGAWGTAVAVLLAARRANGPAEAGREPESEVVLWARSARLVEAMAKNRRNDDYLPSAAFPPELSVTSSLAEALRDAETCVVAVPSR
ncbi:MAG TPA: hypothetical protein VFN61_07815, partial [Acidimicrobiales bacterium]|nr:hypothetical protein [Acidimicrobiales bacterium]